MGRDEQWDNKLQQLGTLMNSARMPRNNGMPGSRGWQGMEGNNQHGWQGQPMMPMQGGNDVQRMMPGPQNVQNMQNLPSSQTVPNMRNMQRMQGSPPAQNMQNMPMMPRSQVAPDVLPNRMQNMPNMQNMMVMPGPPVGHDVPGRQSHDVLLEPRQGQSMPQMGNMQMQFIAVPNGALPPSGAIPMGPMPPARMQEAPSPPMMQVIAVPVGEAPPEGAILIDQFTTPSSMGPTKSEGWQNSPALEPWQNSPKLDAWETPTKQETWQTDLEPKPPATRIETESWMTPSKTDLPRRNKAFKIIDPKTKKEVRSHEEEAASAPRRMRIVNPKTGEEVTK
jgi:hypothetical protein